MKLYDLTIPIIIVGVLVGLIVSGVAAWKLGPNSAVTQEAEDLTAEVIEEGIKLKTGVDVPLEAAVKQMQEPKGK